MLDILRALLGIFVFIAICYALSENRKAINWKLIAGGFGLQLIMAVIFLKFSGPSDIIGAVAQGVVQLLAFSEEGSRFIFGRFVDDAASTGSVFAFRVLPSIIFFSALSSILFYTGILPIMIKGFAWIMRKVMRVSGAESFAVAANIFVGQTEAPLMVRPYLERMTRSELATLMVGGFATIAGGVLVAYVSILGGEDEAKNILFAKHLITASILSAPAAIMFAKLLYPETEEFADSFKVSNEEVGSNVFDAASKGTAQGLQLALIICAILIVFTSLIPLMDTILYYALGSWTGLNGWIASSSGGQFEGLSLQWIFGWVFAPVAWLMGISSGELLNSGRLLGEKLVLNEFVAYLSMGGLIQEGSMMDEKSILIMTYALCGFANFASIGIQIAGLSTLAPGRREELSTLALRAVLGGTLACLMTGALAGILL